jgi:hypothetical protein
MPQRRPIHCSKPLAKKQTLGSRDGGQGVQRAEARA